MLPSGVLFPFLGVSFLLPPFYTCITWNLGLFHKSNFHFELSPGSAYNQTKSTRGARKFKHKGKANPCHSRSLAPDCSDGIAPNTDQQCKLKAAKVKNKIKNKTPRSVNVWSSFSNSGYLIALNLCCAGTNPNNQPVVFVRKNTDNLLINYNVSADLTSWIDLQANTRKKLGL